MPGRPLLLLAALAALAALPAASRAQCDGPRAGRIAAIAGAFAAGQTVVIAVRANDWWTTPTRSFHFANLASPSKEQDRLLHALIGYQTAQVGALLWDWACLPPRTAGWLGAALGIAVTLPKEIGDGLHEDKGFSTPDFMWTAGGALLPALHRTWAPSRAAQLKFNYWPSDELRNRTDGLPQLENDYAGQRYYLAIVPGRLPSGAGAWPDWLGVALGHGVPHWISAPPVHDWFVTLDLNWTGLPIRAAWWRRVAAVLDQVHVPAPGIRVRQGEVTLGLF